MWGELAGIALPFIFGGVSKYFKRRGVKELAKGGLIASGKSGAGLMGVLGGGRVGLEEIAKRGLRDPVWKVFTNPRSGGQILEEVSSGVLTKGSLGKAITQGTTTIEAARLGARATLAEAAGFARYSRAYGLAGKLTSGIIGAQFGFSLFSGADRFFEKNIPPPALEMLQAQQEFLPRMAYTQRQRAIQAIHQSQMTTRAALGNEAQYMH